MNKNMDNAIMGITFCLKRNKSDTIEVQIKNGRVKVNHVSPQVSVRNFIHIGLNNNKINNPKAIQ
jgi:hypothetical protein